MTQRLSPKQHARIARKFDAAFVNYLDLTALLRSDLESMLKEESVSLHWRRNFVRATAALFEGHASSLRRMCEIALSLEPGRVTGKERKAILNEGGLSANERLKYTLRAAYKYFDLAPIPEFDGRDWKRAQRVMG